MSGGAKNLIRMGAKRWGREKLEIKIQQHFKEVLLKEKERNRAWLTENMGLENVSHLSCFISFPSWKMKYHVYVLWE